MGFYREPISTPPRAPGRRVSSPSHAKVRVAAGDSLGDIYSLIAKRFPTAAPTVTVKPAAPPIKGSLLLPLISKPTPTPTAPAPVPTQPRSFSPVSPAPTTPTTTAPTVTTTTEPRTFSPTAGSLPPTPTPSDGGGFIPTPTAPADGGGSVTGGGYVPPPTVDSPVTIRFDSSAAPALLPDATTGPELYNEDGTPANAAAKAASTPSLADTIKNLPTAAKIGGVVLAYILLSR